MSAKVRPVQMVGPSGIEMGGLNGNGTEMVGINGMEVGHGAANGRITWRLHWNGDVIGRSASIMQKNA